MGTKKSGSIWGNANTNLKSRPPIFWIASAHCSVHKTFDVMVITKKVFGMQPQMWIITVSHAANNYESQWTEQRRQKPTIRWDNFIVYIVIPKLHRNNSMRACEIAEGSGVIETNWKRKTSKKWNRNGKVQFWSVIKQTKKTNVTEEISSDKMEIMETVSENEWFSPKEPTHRRSPAQTSSRVFPQVGAVVNGKLQNDDSFWRNRMSMRHMSERRKICKSQIR